MIVDPEDIEMCEKHLCNFVIGDVCHLCEIEKNTVEATVRIGKLESLARAVVNDGGASPALKSSARALL